MLQDIETGQELFKRRQPTPCLEKSHKTRSKSRQTRLYHLKNFITAGETAKQEENINQLFI